MNIDASMCLITVNLLVRAMPPQKSILPDFTNIGLRSHPVQKVGLRTNLLYFTDKDAFGIIEDLLKTVEWETDERLPRDEVWLVEKDAPHLISAKIVNLDSFHSKP